MILEQARKNYDDYIKLLQSLVNIDSGSKNKKGVDKVGRILIDSFKAFDKKYEIEVIEEEECGNHLVITKRGNIPGKILLLAHMDTVFPEGTVAQRPFSIAGNRAYGPGVIDDKGCIASLYYGLKILDEIYEEDTKTIQVIFNSDEEISSIYSRNIIEKYAGDADYAIILESARANGDVVTARKGIAKYVLKVEGKAAHAGSNPQDGVNAIIELCHKAVELSTLTDWDKGTTVNVGLIQGGTSPNTVPDYGEITVDIRISTLEEASKIEKKIQQIAQKKYVPGTMTFLEGGIKRPPLEKNQYSAKIYETVKDLGAEMGIQIGEVFAGGGSDGNFTSALGIPTIDGLGPVGGGYHSKDEYMDLDSVIPRISLLIKLIWKLSHL
ncbi:MAG: M20 family metallopeptidase [Thermotaleaceae bacterium]